MNRIGARQDQELSLIDSTLEGGFGRCLYDREDVLRQGLFKDVDMSTWGRYMCRFGRAW